MVNNRCAGISHLPCILGKAKKTKTQKILFFSLSLSFFCLTDAIQLVPLQNQPLANDGLHTLYIIPFYCALLFRYHISLLGSILLLVQQRQVANFLPFNLQKFPCSRRTCTQEEEPMLPWVNWGRGLAKRQWREVKVFRKTHFSGAKAAGLKDRTGYASAFTSSHEKQGIKTESSLRAERNQRAEQ